MGQVFHVLPEVKKLRDGRVMGPVHIIQLGLELRSLWIQVCHLSLIPVSAFKDGQPTVQGGYRPPYSGLLYFVSFSCSNRQLPRPHCADWQQGMSSTQVQGERCSVQGSPGAKPSPRGFQLYNPLPVTVTSTSHKGQRGEKGWVIPKGSLAVLLMS